MPKFRGAVGFAQPTEKEPGLWVEEIVERKYSGDLIQMRRLLQSTEHIHDDMTLSVEISIVGDDFALNNFGLIRYVALGGVKWKVSKVNPQFPRLILTVGGVYNGGMA